MRPLALVLLAAACGDVDPCEDLAGTCIALAVESDTVAEVDLLELDLLYGATHATVSTGPGSGVAALPLATAISLDVPEPVSLGVVAAGKLGGTVLGTGFATATIEPGARASLAIVLAPPDDCVAGSFYCGGDRLAGDPGTLYQCNAGGVPLARGVCELGCLVRPGDDDACRGSGDCVEGGDYCGGNKVDGDPQSLYRCTGGVGTNRRECADGCVIRPGDDDICR